MFVYLEDLGSELFVMFVNLCLEHGTVCFYLLLKARIDVGRIKDLEGPLLLIEDSEPLA